MVTIKIKEAKKEFSKKNFALNPITVNFESNKIYGITGKNGSGKTVFLKCICGLMNLTEGKITILGKDIGKDIDFSPDVGMIIETPGFVNNISGYKNLSLLASINNKITKSDIEKNMRKLELDPSLKTPVSQYSLGMKQKLGFVQAIMENPSIIILDEPFNNLDEHSIRLCRDILKEQKQLGKTIILTTHNDEDIAILCDKVYTMNCGNWSNSERFVLKDKPI